MSSSESDSDTSYKKGKKRKRSRSRSHKLKNKSRSRRDTKSHDRSSKHSRHKSSKNSYQHKSSKDKSPKYKSSREILSKDRANKSPMRHLSQVKSSKGSSPYLESRSRDTKSKHKVELEKIDTKEQIKKALQAAISVDEQLRQNLALRDSEHDFTKQQERAEQINDIEKGDFIQTDFKSTRSEIPMPKGSQVDASHASAMFGNFSWKDDVSKIKNKDESMNEIIQLMHPNLLQNAEEKFEKWKDKLYLMRKFFLKSNRGQLPWQIQ